jgi:hypothetical protein
MQKKEKINIYLSKGISWVYQAHSTEGASTVIDDTGIVGLSECGATRGTLSHELGHIFGLNKGPWWARQLLNTVYDTEIDWFNFTVRNLGFAGIVSNAGLATLYLIEAKKFSEERK